MIISLYPDKNYFYGPCYQTTYDGLPDNASLGEIEVHARFYSFNPEMDLNLPLSDKIWNEISDSELLDKFIVHFNEKDKELSRELLIYDLSEETLSLLVLMYGGNG